MRFLLPEVASSIGFFVTALLFTLFAFVVYGVFKKKKDAFKEIENLPLDDL